MMPDRQTINGVTYCKGSAGSFLLHCPKCASPNEPTRYRCESHNPYEMCWTCKGPMEALTTLNLHLYKWKWGEILGA